MTSRRILVVGAITVVAVMLVWLVLVALPRRYGPATDASAAASATGPAPSGRKIKARLFYVGDDGTRLVGVERDVTFSEGTVGQAKEILNAQIAPVTEPLVSAVPPGTTLRAVFVTENGDAYVDLSREVVAAHPGGSTNELLTVFTLVNVLTANLPAVSTVQVLVDGKEVDTLAGHVDLRRPLAKDLAWVQ